MSVCLFVLTESESVTYPFLAEWTRLFDSAQETMTKLENDKSTTINIVTEDQLCHVANTIRSNETACHEASNMAALYFTTNSEDIRQEVLLYLRAPERPVQPLVTTDKDMGELMATVLESIPRPTEETNLKQAMSYFLRLLDDAYNRVSTEPTLTAVARVVILEQMRETLVSASEAQNVTLADMGLTVVTAPTILITVFAEIPEIERQLFLYTTMYFLFYYRNYVAIIEQ